jgi:hypothetical protein
LHPTKIEKLRRADSALRETIFQLSTISGTLPGNLTRFSAAASHPQLVQFETFDEALASAQIPVPQFFGVVSYGLLQNGAQELMQLEPTIMDPQTTVRAKASPDGIRYVARTREEDSQFLVYTWDLRLPDYVPLTFYLDQGLNGQLTRIRSQRLFWEKSPNGIERPFRIAAENPAVKRKPGGGYHLGRKSIDVELVWLEPEQINKMSLAEFTDIQKYLDIGEAIAKRKESDPSE